MALSDDLLSGSRVLLDLSMVSSLDELNENLPRESLLVGATLDQVLRMAPSQELAGLLEQAAMPRDPAPQEREALAISVTQLTLSLRAYRSLAERGVVSVIADEVAQDPEIARLVDSVGQELSPELRITLPDATSVSPRSLVRTHLTTVLTYSRRTRMAILAQGRSLVSRVRGEIPTLELPDRVNDMVERKSAFTTRFFKTRSARSGKVLVGIAVAGVGVFLASTPVGVAGLLFACVDP